MFIVIGPCPAHRGHCLDTDRLRDFAPIFGVVLPYAAVLVFIIGNDLGDGYGWAKSPVPFCIPTTGEQEQSFHLSNRTRLTAQAPPGE